VLSLDSKPARWWSLSVGWAAPSAAPDFLFAQFAGGAGRWPSYGVVADLPTGKPFDIIGLLHRRYFFRPMRDRRKHRDRGENR
jgi:hypothetical protein